VSGHEFSLVICGLVALVSITVMIRGEFTEIAREEYGILVLIGLSMVALIFPLAVTYAISRWLFGVSFLPIWGKGVLFYCLIGFGKELFKKPSFVIAFLVFKGFFPSAADIKRKREKEEFEAEVERRIQMRSGGDTNG